MEPLSASCVRLLQQLIATPSFSREENQTADLLERFLRAEGIAAKRSGHNVWALSKNFRPGRPTLLLNSHHDTVRPNPAYTRNPFEPASEGDRLYGLGSNDAGGALVSMIGTFLHLNQKTDRNYNLVLAATAEEEISGTGGIEMVWPELPPVDCAIVGEPTLLHVAIAEKGLLVLDCEVAGVAGHAARDEGRNAIYEALPVLDWFRTYRFPKSSAALGHVKMSVTMIQAGQAHNQVPPICRFTVDVRVTDAYTLPEILALIQQHVSCRITPRSLRLRPSGIDPQHGLVRAARKTGRAMYGSPTTSDMALIPVPAIKMGPGDSARSHSANEFIYLYEIGDGIKAYIDLLENWNETLAER